MLLFLFNLLDNPDSSMDDVNIFLKKWLYLTQTNNY